MNYNNFFSRKDALSKLKLSAVEYCVLGDMKRAISKLRNNSAEDNNCNFTLPLFENYNEKYVDKFFLSLGSDRAKQLINLFCKIKTRISDSMFETEVFLLYLCIENICLVNLLYCHCDCDCEDNCLDCIEPTLEQQFKNIKKMLIMKLEDFGVFV
ncbi:P52 family lipoprotein [Borreliella garinii]|uniref:P52 family lipoprotein n=2 Tax=Borreliella garinii TaxID=29519 RepID=UPI001AEDAD36|nr:P52 family lipoprotein [Borreliella garinii]